MKTKGFGVEDTPFMLVLVILIMLVITWIGVNTLEKFIEGNERQDTIDAAIEIFKRARVVALGYENSSEELSVSLPPDYAILINDSIIPVTNVAGNLSPLATPLEIPGVAITSENTTIPSGSHTVHLVYRADDGNVFLSWD